MKRLKAVLDTGSGVVIDPAIRELDRLPIDVDPVCIELDVWMRIEKRHEGEPRRFVRDPRHRIVEVGDAPPHALEVRQLVGPARTVPHARYDPRFDETIDDLLRVRELGRKRHHS